jgi:hypothetical protein
MFNKLKKWIHRGRNGVEKYLVAGCKLSGHPLISIPFDDLVAKREIMLARRESFKVQIRVQPHLIDVNIHLKMLLLYI